MNIKFKEGDTVKISYKENKKNNFIKTSFIKKISELDISDGYVYNPKTNFRRYKKYFQLTLGQQKKTVYASHIKTKYCTVGMRGRPRKGHEKITFFDSKEKNNKIELIRHRALLIEMK